MREMASPGSCTENEKEPKASAGNDDQARIEATAKGRISSNVMAIINPIQ